MSKNGVQLLDRRDFLILKLAIKRGWLEPQALQAVLTSEGKPALEQLVEERCLSRSRVEKLCELVTPRLEKTEPSSVFKRKERLFRRFLLEGQECSLGAISSALTDQKKGNGGVPIGEILVRKGMLEQERFDALRQDVEDHFYRHQAALLCGSPDDAEPEIPQLNDFEVLEEIGRGGMGIIYRARQKGLDRIVALKVLDRGHTHETKIRRFKREAKALSQLRHPNIVSILQVGEERGWHFFSMELIEGETLEQVFDRGDRPLVERLRLVAQVCSGVAYAHQKGILHRDIKPANIILDAKGVPKLTDFGLARSISEDTLLTRDGAILGTPFYMSPEQIKGNRAQIGPQTDQFALGVMLYEAACGELPFHGTSSVEIYHKILHDEPIPLERMVEDAPEGLGLIQRKAMAKEPEARYEQVQELADDLDALLDGRPISVSPPGLARRAWCQICCHQFKLVAIALLLLCLITGVIWWRNLRRQMRTPDKPRVERPAPTRPEVPDGPGPDDQARLTEQLEALETQMEHALVAREYEKVHELAARMRKLSPSSAISYLYDARAHWQTRHRDKQAQAREVITATQHALQRDSKLLRAYVLQGRAYHSVKRHRRAYQVFSRGLKIEPGQRDCLYWRAFTLLALDKPAESLADLTQLLERHPADLNVRFLRGLVYMRMGLNSKAIADFSRYLSKRPDYALAWYYRGQCYEKEDKLQLAITDYRRSLEAGLPPADAKQARLRLTELERRLR